MPHRLTSIMRRRGGARHRPVAFYQREKRNQDSRITSNSSDSTGLSLVRRIKSKYLGSTRGRPIKYRTSDLSQPSVSWGVTRYLPSRKLRCRSDTLKVTTWLSAMSGTAVHGAELVTR